MITQDDYLLVLAEERKFSKAAQRLYISQPALSQYIQKLEKQIGMQLFDRSTSPFTLTPAGELYVEAAKHSKRDQWELDKKISDLSGLKLGKLRIGTSAFRASCMLPDSIRMFGEKYPGVKLEICTDQVDVLVKKLIESEIDMCVVSDCFDPDLFDVQELTTETHYLAVPKSHRINKVWEKDQLTPDDIISETDHFFDAEPVKIADVADEDFVYMNTDSELYETYLHMCLESRVVPKRVLETEQIETAFYWVNTNIVFGLLPDTLIRWLGKYQNNAYYYKLDLPSSSQRIVVAKKQNGYVSSAMKEYEQLLKDSFGKDL